MGAEQEGAGGGDARGQPGQLGRGDHQLEVLGGDEVGDLGRVLEAVDDEAAARVLTSMVTRIDLAVYDAARDYLDGQFTGGDIVAGLDSGWLTWSDDGGNLDPIADQLDQVQALVVSGAIAVPSTP